MALERERERERQREREKKWKVCFIITVKVISFLVEYEVKCINIC